MTSQSNPTSSASLTARKALRRELRARRNALSKRMQHQAARALAKRLLQSAEVRAAKHIALYLSNDGEISPHIFVKALSKARKSLYLPILHPAKHHHLWFQAYTAHTPMTRNKYGISEPKLNTAQRIKPEQLDLVLMPLVGFDPEGGRLGMGGGYYDRTFAFTHPSQVTHKQHKGVRPKLLGLAHECQKVESLAVAAWDIPMHAVVTDRAIYHCEQ